MQSSKKIEKERSRIDTRADNATFNMDATQMPQTDDIQVGVDSIRPLITSFFQRLSAEQLESLKSFSPDVATKIMLADLLVEIIRYLSDAFLEATKSTNTVMSAVQSKMREN